MTKFQRIISALALVLIATTLFILNRTHQRPDISPKSVSSINITPLVDINDDKLKHNIVSVKTDLIKNSLPESIPDNREIFNEANKDISTISKKLDIVQQKTNIVSKVSKSLTSFKPFICDNSTSIRLNQKLLSDDNIKWCQWALSSSGGAVKVGKSWGKLTKPQQVEFEKLTCNSIASENNPSCNDKWGDAHVKKWRTNRVLPNNLQCIPGRQSSVSCYHNENKEQFCVLERAKVDFTKYETLKRGGGPDSKRFQQSFLSVDCNDQPPQSREQQERKEPGFSFPHLFSTQYSTSKCDVTIGGTTLLYSHDNIRNLCHTMNDIMNVWLQLWLDKSASRASEVSFLSIDALKQYNNFGDTVNSYFLPYQKTFANVTTGSAYEGKVVCMDRLLIQSHPARGFIWDGWERVSQCREAGPSSLAQRFNIHSRQSMGLIGESSASSRLSDTIKVLLIVRTESKNDWGSYRSSRLFKNLPSIQTAMSTVLEELKRKVIDKKFELVVQDMGKLSFEEQLHLVSSTSVIVGMHGAGISMSNFMSIGGPNCCGVLEIYPKGEFSNVQGHENMIRRSGISYSRIDIDKINSHDSGAIVPVDTLKAKLNELIHKVMKVPSCVLSEVMEDPFLDSD